MPSSRSTVGLPPGVHLGQTGPRLLAALVEVGPIWLLCALSTLLGFVLVDREFLAVLCLLLALVWAIVVWAQRATRVAGPGMRLDSLQIVRLSDGRPLGWGRVLLRGLVFVGLTLSVVGLLAMAVAMSRHPRRQGWHDLAADAVVIKERLPAAPHRGSAITPAEGPVPPPNPSEAPLSVESPVAVRTAMPMPFGGSALEPTGGLHAVSMEAAAVLDRPDLDWWLRLDDGRQIAVDGLVLLGRNPQPRVGEEDAMLIKVVDPSRTVSKSHLAVGTDGRRIYVVDRGSTNGTSVTGSDGVQRPCPPGDLVDLSEGAVIGFGDHWLEVRRREP